MEFPVSFLAAARIAARFLAAGMHVGKQCSNCVRGRFRSCKAYPSCWQLVAEVEVKVEEGRKCAVGLGKAVHGRDTLVAYAALKGRMHKQDGAKSHDADSWHMDL